MGKKGDKTTNLKVTSCSAEPELVVGSFFNGLTIPESTHFDLYRHRLQSENYVIHGENSTLEYNGEIQCSEQHDYLVAFYDKKSRSVQLFRSPVIPASVISKERALRKGPKVRLRGLRSMEQRTALGREFGTKKAKAAITNLDRNRIDSSRLQEMEVNIVDHIKFSASEAPEVVTMVDSAVANKVTPSANALATKVEDIYTLQSIIPSAEWKSIRVHPIMEEADVDVRLEMLSYSKSTFVNKRLSSFVSRGSTQKVQMLYYASLLFGVYANRRSSNKDSLLGKLENKPSEVLIDGVLDRFTAVRTTGYGKAKERSFVIDPFHEDKLLCYLLTLILLIDNFTTEINPLANELNIKATRLSNLFRALGATIKPVSAALAENLGISKKNVSSYKIAVLKVPFKEPELIKRRAK